VILYSVTLFYMTVWMMLYNLFCNYYILAFCLLKITFKNSER